MAELPSSRSAVYVVIGSTGEYSDHCYWFVAAFGSRETADAKAQALNDKARELGLQAETEYGGRINLNYSEQEERAKLMKPLDPQFSVGYTGTGYTVEELPFNPAESE